jgi:hypothetical protein
MATKGTFRDGASRLARENFLAFVTRIRDIAYMRGQLRIPRMDSTP